MPKINLGERVQFQDGKISNGEFVLHLSCFRLDVDGGEHRYWKFVLSGKEYVRFLMEPMQKLENARHRKANTAA